MLAVPLPVTELPMPEFFARFIGLVRALARKRAFLSMAVSSLALGVGATTAIFALVYSALLRPAPFPRGDELVSIGHLKRETNSRLGVSAPSFRFFTTGSRVLERTALVSGWNPTWSRQGAPKRLRGARVSASYFDLLGNALTLGRTFAPSEEIFGNDRVVVLSRAFWQSELGGDSSVLGSTLQLDGASRVVVGIAPFGDEVMEGGEVDIWTPLALGEGDFAPEFWGRDHYRMIARTKPGIDVAALARDMSRIERDVRAAGLRSESWGTWAMQLGEQARGQWRPALWLLFAATGLLLLITCANVAGLYMSRLPTMLHEASIRAALGASPRHLLRAAVAESIVLAAVGGAVGFALGSAMVGVFRPTIMAVLVGIRPPVVSGFVLLFCLVVVALVGIAVGLVPGIQLTRKDLAPSIRQGQRGASEGRGWLQDVLIVGEVALAVLLLISAISVSKSFRQLTRVNLGYDPQPVAMATVELPMPRYMGAANQSLFAERVRSELESVRGVQSVGAGLGLPQSAVLPTSSFEVQDRPQGGQDSEPWGEFALISPGTMEALGYRLVAGRFFNAQDQQRSTPVVIIDEELARTYWPNQSALGRYITSGLDSAVWREVVGVVGHVRLAGPLDDVRTQRYIPLAQFSFPQLTFVARFARGVRPDPDVIRAAVQRVDPSLALAEPSRLSERAGRSLGRSRLLASLFVVFSSLATLFAALGVFAVVSRAVERRRLEFGIRLALGAEPTDLAVGTLRHGIKLGAAGATIGIPLSAAALKVGQGLLHEIPPFSALMATGVAIAAIAVAAAAAWLPAKRATAVDPQSCLRGAEGG